MSNKRTEASSRYNRYLEQQQAERMQEIRERLAIAEKLKAEKRRSTLLRRYAR